MSNGSSAANAGAHPAPSCERWMLGDITVAERDGPVKYERAILVTFKTIEEFRAALKYCDPLWTQPTESSGARS